MLLSGFTNGISTAFGQVDIDIKGDDIEFTGVRTHFLQSDLKRLYGTTRVGLNIIDAKRHSFKIKSFFLPDFLFIINQLLANKSRYGLPINTLYKIKNLLLTQTWLKDIEKDQPKKLDRSKLKHFKLKPLDFQNELFEIYEHNTQAFRLNGFLFAGSAGSGKAQPLDALIKVPGGWIKMGDARVGQSIIAKDGSISKITGVYPQGEKEIFKVTFSDGRSAECCGDHLWTIMRPNRGLKLNDYRETITTNKIIELLSKETYKGRIHIDLIRPEVGEELDLPIHPYVLGTYLGDGSFTNPAPTFTTPDAFLISEISRFLPENTYMKKINCYTEIQRCPSYSYSKIDSKKPSEMTEGLKKLGLFGKRSWEKSIPKFYLNASLSQRLALLQGLMDTDGYIDTQSTSSYCSTSKQLALDVQYLVRSLGGIAIIAEKTKFFTYNGEKKLGRLAYQVNIRFKQPSLLFRLEKKRVRANDDGQYTANLRLRIESIEPIGKKQAQCISISHPEQLYITNDFVVTHNTLASLFLSECLNADKVIIVAPKNAMHTAWVDNITKHFIKQETYWTSDSNIPFTGNERYQIVNYEYLSKLLDNLDKLKYKKIFIVLDESHNLNETTSARSEYFIQLCKQTKCTDVLWLSGTPFKAMSLEAIPFLRCIDPLFTPEVEEKFKAVFRGDSSAATTILNNRLGIVSFKVEKERLNLAAPIFKSIPVSFKGSEVFTLDHIKVQMSEFIKERKAYYDARRDEDRQFFFFWLRQYELSLRSQKDMDEYRTYRQSLSYIIQTNADASAKEQILFCNKFEKAKIIPIVPTDLRQQFIDVRSVIKYLHLKIQGECLGRVVGRARINCHVEMAKHLRYDDVCESTEKKTIVFTSYVEVLEQAAKTAQEQELAPAIVYAKTNNDLSKIVQAFGQDKRVNPLIATYASLSTAVPLVMADTMILIDVPFRDYILQQTVSRIHRIGADTQTTVYTCALDTQGQANISTRTVDILKWSQQETEAILGIASPFDIRDTEDNLQTAIEQHVDKIEGSQFVYSFESTDKPKYLKW